jgi:hypothetical protein
MSLPTATKNVVEKKLDAFLGKRVPPQVADKIRLSYTFRGNSVTIWEPAPHGRKPCWNGLPPQSRNSVIIRKPKRGCSIGATGTVSGTKMRDWRR